MRYHLFLNYFGKVAKVMPFQLGGFGSTSGDATPSYITDSRSSILGLSNEVSFVSRFF